MKNPIKMPVTTYPCCNNPLPTLLESKIINIRMN